MKELNPKAIFKMLAIEIPRALHKNVYIVGSLAAAPTVAHS